MTNSDKVIKEAQELIKEFEKIAESSCCYNETKGEFETLSDSLELNQIKCAIASQKRVVEKGEIRLLGFFSDSLTYQILNEEVDHAKQVLAYLESL